MENKKKMKRVKVWGKLRLYETSAVGIPAYPDAHASAGSFSLIKALSNAKLKGFVEEKAEVGGVIKLTKEETETMENNESQADEKVEEVKEEAEAEVAAPVEAEAVAEAPVEPEAEPTEPEAEKKSDMSEVIAKAIKDGIKEGLGKLEVSRGVVERQTETNKSLGELAIGQGLFVK